jgi:6-phosphogluconate dehydrogenase
MQLGFVGLGKMGANMVHRIQRDSEHECVVFDHHPESISTAEGHGAQGASSLQELVSMLDAPRTVWIMVPAGDPTESTVEELGELMDEGDTIVDGGNSRWTDDKRRQELLRPKGVYYVDVGTSGGVWGLSVGYCMMVGGDDEPVERLSPILDVLAPPPTEEHGPGWGHFGTTGAGHYVKMVHNGIEYGMMQAYAEGFAILHSSDLEIDALAAVKSWQEGSVVRSWLLDLLVLALDQTPDFEGIRGVAADSGEGRWTINEAVRLGVAAPVISAALFARFVSQDEDQLTMKVIAALRHQFGGHTFEKAP